MKSLTRVLIITIAFFVSLSVIDAQSSKGKKQSSIKKSKTIIKQKSKSKIKSGTKKIKANEDKKGSYQKGVIDPIVREAKYKNGEPFESDDDFKICLDNQVNKASWYQRKYGIGKSYDKWQKGKALSSSDKKKIFSEASKCEKSGSKQIDDHGSTNKKGYKNTGKTGKGAKKGKVG